jgi:hypothetical protein
MGCLGRKSLAMKFNTEAIFALRGILFRPLKGALSLREIIQRSYSGPVGLRLSLGVGPHLFLPALELPIHFTL